MKYASIIVLIIFSVLIILAIGKTNSYIAGSYDNVLVEMNSNLSLTKADNCTLGAPIELKPGQSVSIDNNTIIKFISVVEDSRCPEDIECVWGGEAIIKFGLIEGKNVSNFNLSSGEVPREKTLKKVGPYLIGLHYRLTPSTSLSRKIEPSEYRATLIINRIDSLLRDLTSKNNTAQRYAMESLGTIREIRVVEPLIENLKNNDSDNRENSISALGEIGDKRAVEPLIKALNDNVYVQEYAVIALGKIKDTRAVEPLIQALKSNDSDIRNHAAEALGELNDTSAVEPLIQTLKDNESYVRESAAEALKKLRWKSDS